MSNQVQAINSAPDELSKQTAYAQYAQSMQNAGQTPRPYSDFK